MHRNVLILEDYSKLFIRIPRKNIGANINLYSRVTYLRTRQTLCDRCATLFGVPSAARLSVENLNILKPGN